MNPTKFLNQIWFVKPFVIRLLKECYRLLINKAINHAACIWLKKILPINKTKTNWNCCYYSCCRVILLDLLYSLPILWIRCCLMSVGIIPSLMLDKSQRIPSRHSLSQYCFQVFILVIYSILLPGCCVVSVGITVWLILDEVAVV